MFRESYWWWWIFTEDMMTARRLAIRARDGAEQARVTLTLKVAGGARRDFARAAQNATPVSAQSAMRTHYRYHIRNATRAICEFEDLSQLFPYRPSEDAALLLVLRWCAVYRRDDFAAYRCDAMRIYLYAAEHMVACYHVPLCFLKYAYFWRISFADYISFWYISIFTLLGEMLAAGFINALWRALLLLLSWYRIYIFSILLKVPMSYYFITISWIAFPACPLREALHTGSAMRRWGDFICRHMSAFSARLPLYFGLLDCCWHAPAYARTIYEKDAFRASARRRVQLLIFMMSFSEDFLI